MSVARIARGALLGALAAPFGCGQRSGDPIVLSTSPGANGQAGGGGGATSGGASSGGAPWAGAALGGTAGASAGTSASDGGEPPVSLDTGPTGLCGDCSSSDECGDANDACIRHLDQRFCGRDCDEQRGCPGGYACVQLENSPLWQCVPADGCAAPSVAAPSLDVVRQYILTRINNERAARDRPALLASSCLDELAQRSALAFARTDEPLGKYVKECDPVWPNCECGWSAEAELTVAGYALDWTTAVESAVDPSRDQNARFTQAFLTLKAPDAGVGFWLSGDEAWIALSLH
jgi:hypothetical protein